MRFFYDITSIHFSIISKLFYVYNIKCNSQANATAKSVL